MHKNEMIPQDAFHFQTNVFLMESLKIEACIFYKYVILVGILGILALSIKFHKCYQIIQIQSTTTMFTVFVSM